MNNNLEGDNRRIEIENSVKNITIISGDGNIPIITITNYNYNYREETKVESIESIQAQEDENLPCPYRGLFHFGPNDTKYFFGRKVFIEELFAATQTRNFITVLGASGSGKSSVVLAGLVPRLQKESNWLFTHFRPGSDPFYALAESLVPLYTSGDATVQIAQARVLANYFHDRKVTLPDIFSHIEQQHPNHRVLLIADQFEELYTLCSDEKIRRNFLDNLLPCFQSSPSGLQSSHVLIATMRADFLGNALSYPQFGEVLRNNDIKIRSMNHDELSEVIVKPAQKLGVTFESGLVERILGDVENEAGNLPLLEFALTELWKQRTGKQLTHAAYEKIGEVQGALARHADRNYSKLSVTQREQVRRIFIQLVRPGEEAEDTRRLATKAELSEGRWGLVKTLADARLVVTSQNAANQETVEIVHEALIRNWRELQQWMDTDRSFRIWQERLRAAMYQWEQTPQDEGALLRGTALAEAQGKLEEYREDLSKGEQEFIQASVELCDRQKKQRSLVRRLTFSGLAGGLVLALGLAGLASINWRDAEINQIKLLVQNSDGLLSLDARKALLSSVKAAVEMQDQLWGVDENTRTQVELALLNTVHNVAAPNTLGGHAQAVRAVSFSPDGKMLASASYDNTVKLWDTTTYEEIKTLTGHRNMVWNVSFSPDGKILASASEDNTVKLWDTTTYEEIKTLTGHTNSLREVSFSPDGKILASASLDKTVKLWDTNTHEEIKTLKGHTNRVNEVSFSPDGKILVSASFDKTVKLWDTNTHEIIKNLGTSEVYDVSFAPSVRNTYSYPTFGSGTLPPTTNSSLSIASQKIGNVLASAHGDKTVKLWDTTTSEKIKTLTGHTKKVNGIAFSPVSGSEGSAAIATPQGFGKILASASSDNTVKLWNTATHKEIKTLKGHTNEVNGVGFSPDGKILASASSDNTVKLWDTTTHKEIKTLKGHTSWVNDVTFSPDGKILASASSDNTVKLWDTTTHKKIKTLKGHTNEVFDVSFAPSARFANSPVSVATPQGFGKILASASRDRTVKLWDITTGKEIKTLSGHTSYVWGVSFAPSIAIASPQGIDKILASASQDNTVKLWNWDFDYLLNEGCDFMREYFKANPPDESDKNMCDGVPSNK